MHFTYRTAGTCSLLIDFDLDQDIVHNVRYLKGCNGNLQAVSRLVEGMHTQELIDKLKGINCNGKGTSCADQLAKAVEQARINMANQ